MTTTHGILFDLDGVLLDTEGIYSEFWSRVDARYPTGTPNFAQVIKGSNLATILNDHFPSELHSAVISMLDGFQQDMRYEFFPHALERLSELRAAGVAMSVVTSSDRKKMSSVYAQHPAFRNYFADVVTGDMVERPKPNPECFLLGARRLGIACEDCLIFEDSLNGLKAARASGAKVIGLATTNRAEDLSALADVVINDWSELTVDDILSMFKTPHTL